MKESIFKQFTPNLNGVQIVKCCASCVHKDADKDIEKRLCKLHNFITYKDRLCKDWQMAEELRNIKILANGRVKRPSYLHWLKEQVGNINSQNIDINAKNRMIDRLPHIYEVEFGKDSRYLSSK